MSSSLLEKILRQIMNLGPNWSCIIGEGIDFGVYRSHTGVTSNMQLSFNKRRRTSKAAATLAELKQGEQGVLESIDLPEDTAQRLMELGFLPGAPVTRALSAPGGDPRIYRVDGSEVALRRETAKHLLLKVQKKTT